MFALKVYDSDSYCSGSDSEGIFSCGLHSFVVVVVVFCKIQTNKKGNPIKLSGLNAFSRDNRNDVTPRTKWKKKIEMQWFWWSVFKT